MRDNALENVPMERIALGTAQLGLPYGIANRSGKPDLAKAGAIIDKAWNHGIRWFDTAQAYGNSESVLGQCLKMRGWSGEAKIVSKLDPATDIQSEKEIRQRVLESLERLEVPALAGFLLHREELSEAWAGVLGMTLNAVKNEGFVHSLGVSVYSPKMAVMALHLEGIDMLQVPANVFDRRMLRGGVFQLAKERKQTIFIRSVYLQGLALMAPGELPPAMAFAQPAVAAFSEFCRQRGIGRKEFAFAYVRYWAPEGIAVIGAETPEQVDENCRLTTQGVRAEDILAWDQHWPEDDDQLIDPSRWPVKG